MTEPTLATDLIPLSEQFDNHDGYRPDPTDALAGPWPLPGRESVAGGVVMTAFMGLM